MTGDESIDHVRDGYGKTKYEQLITLKATYDPGNFFCPIRNIPPRKL